MICMSITHVKCMAFFAMFSIVFKTYLSWYRHFRPRHLEFQNLIVIKGYDNLRYIQYKVLGFWLVEKHRTCYEVELVLVHNWTQSNVCFYVFK